ncbi:RISC-loading complex subunit tarbp2 isoform X2 [Camponotus floridanus]|nr:RISC-loading complex subunit tarbp2 isoform X2 [Camponotus floridanus]
MSRTMIQHKMSKSPISLLQELGSKQGYVPIYNYVSVKKVGIYDRFVCRVDCKEFNAEGEGNSKKDAKHNAAEKMLSLLAAKNEISVLSPIANKVQTSMPIKTYESILPSTMKTQSSPKIVNYVGLLQEFCVQQELLASNIVYKVVDERGPDHMKMFTIEVSIGSICEKGSASCKKIAKQEAAKNLLQHLHPDVKELLERNNEKNNKASSKEMLQETIQKLGIEISECVVSKPTLPVANLSKEAQTLYMKRTNKECKVTRQDFLLKNLHDLFERTYSTKISFNMREKMQIVRDKYINRADVKDVKEVVQDIARALEIKIEKIILPSITKGSIISLRLSSQPIITQLGMGETEDKAEIQAMYNVIVTILTFLNIS